MAYKKIQFKRGTKTGMPVLRSGEPGFTQDEKSLYIGDGTANQRFLNEVQVGTKIDEKIAPVTQSITNNVAALNESIASNVTTVNQAITDKAKINGEATNVNFIENEIVKDGLVYSAFNIKYDGTNYTNVQANTESKNITLQMKGKVEGSYAFINPTSSYFLSLVATTGEVKIASTNRVIFTLNRFDIAEYNMLITLIDDVLTVSNNGETKSGKLTSIELETFKNINVNLYATWDGATKSKGLINWFVVYNRTLTPQEIQHNFSVLNNTPSINKINDYAISTDTDHIQDRTGRVQEQINRVFYKNMCKEFTSDGSAISVNNGMNGYVLSGTIQGQTVKNYLTGDVFKKVAKSISDTLAVEIELDNKKCLKLSSVTDTSDKPLCSSFKENTRYTVSMTSKVVNVNGESVYTSGLVIKVNYKDGTSSNMFFSPTQGTITDWKNESFTTKDNASVDKIYLTYGAGYSVAVILDTIQMVEGVSKHVGDIPFGLNSTQATISNLGMKYSFYANLEDKLANRVLDLGGMEGARNTFTINEDGNATLTSSSLKKVLNGTETWIYDTVYPPTNTLYARFYSQTTTCLRNSSGIADIVPFEKGITSSTNKFCVGSNAGSDYIEIIIEKAKLDTLDVNGIKKRLSNNNITLLCQLITPIVTTIPRELVPAILTQATNNFTFGEGVAPSSVAINMPVNKMADLETRLGQLEAVITSASNLSLMGNYADDEYNDSLNQL